MGGGVVYGCINILLVEAGFDDFLADLVQDGAPLGGLAGGLVQVGVFDRNSRLVGICSCQATMFFFVEPRLLFIEV